MRRRRVAGVRSGGSRVGEAQIKHVLDGSDAGEGFLGKNAELQGKRSGKLSFEVDGTAAHSRDHAGMFDFRALEFHEDDGLFGSQEIGEDADDFEVELFDLVAGKDRVGIPFHAGLDLIERKNVLRILSAASSSAG